MTIEVMPREYYLDYGVRQPLCEVESGTEIATRLVDAHGYDLEMQRVADSPNPLTGPFTVRGAQPGDALAVTILDLIPNRRRGWASKSLHPNLRIPGRHVEPYRKEYIDWEIDLTAMTARPPKEYFPQREVVIPLRPVLGCIGVAAAAASAPPSNQCGAFGGNLDYTRIKPGVTLYLPVQVEGGYLYVGDGHATQGDGEITGNGIEISFDIRFVVKVVKAAMAWPRGEDSEMIFCLANVTPMDEALRLATAEMELFLGGTYGMTKDQIGILMGQLVKYEVGNFVSKAYCAACLMPKPYLG